MTTATVTRKRRTRAAIQPEPDLIDILDADTEGTAEPPRACLLLKHLEALLQQAISTARDLCDSAPDDWPDGFLDTSGMSLHEILARILPGILWACQQGANELDMLTGTSPAWAVERWLARHGKA